ncbi:MAG: histidine phosphatase family protein, partial [Lachnospiraceae bacterium]|nr:histidine phosphatase family protein [Lachnospiraceae bacterium]
AKEKIDEVYISPLGRAKKTAEACLKKMDPGIKPVTLDWLMEFAPRIKRPDKPERESICWDWMPEDWTVNDIFFDYDKWTEHPVFAEANVKEELTYVLSEFEELLKELGYERSGKYFKAVKPNNDTVALFCHFGLESVLLSYLLNIPTMLLWHGFIAAPTSVTTVYTEERREGKAYFRVSAFGDTSHLYVADEPPAFSGRFCECFTNENERH